MDEKTKNESETQTEQELSVDNDSTSAENSTNQKSVKLEYVASEAESIDSQIKGPPLDDHPTDSTIPVAAEAPEPAEKTAEIETAETPPLDGFEPPAQAAEETQTEVVDTAVNSAEIEAADAAPVEDSGTAAETEAEIETDAVTRQADKAALNNITDDPETARPPDDEREETGQESDESETESEHETSQLDPNAGDAAEAAEKETQGGNDDNDHDEKGADTEGKETENVAKSDSSETAEVEEIKGSSEEQTPTEETDEKIENKDDIEGDDPATQTQIKPETADADEETTDLAEEKIIEPPARKISALKVTVSAVIITAAFFGFFLFDNKSKIKAASQKASKTLEKREISKNRVNKKKMIKPLTPKISSIYDAKIEEVTALRDRLLLKQDEVMRLKKHYQDGIEELEKEISDELQKGGSNTFLQAMENNSIAYTLRTIQRRQAYIQQLERPLKWIDQACEELLYIKRRTLMDLKVGEIAGGIDMNKHVRHINAAVRKYQPAADKLAPEMTNAQREPLEVIWERIQEKTQQHASVRAYSKNQIISEQICTGNFNRLTELSEISNETAKCITEMQTSDLFLNGLSEISPGAAKQLFHWNGSWICLNGVRALSPRAAHYLFQWDGNWISLNGLTEFPAEIGETLLQWNGRQLELMGLQYIEDYPARIALEYLARWERTGGKLFVPQNVRKKIDEWHRKST